MAGDWAVAGVGFDPLSAIPGLRILSEHTGYRARLVVTDAGRRHTAALAFVIPPRPRRPAR